MRFQPDSDYSDLDVIDRITAARECEFFEAKTGGSIAVSALREARDRAMSVVLGDNVSERDADRARGALDVLNHLLEHGLGDYRRVLAEVSE